MQIPKKVRWQCPPKKVTLSIHEIHTWRIDLDENNHDLDSLTALLHADEIKQADRFKFPIHRHRFIVGRAHLRLILSRYLSYPPKTIYFEYGSHGKPYIHTNNPQHIEFNLAHSDALAVYAITCKHPIGIDIEKTLARPFVNIAKRFFAEKECHAISEVTKDKQAEVFYHIWTQKEAFIKAIGEGLAYPLDQFVVSATEGKLLEIHDKKQHAEDWALLSFIPQEAYTAALATKQVIRKVLFFG